MYTTPPRRSRGQGCEIRVLDVLMCALDPPRAPDPSFCSGFAVGLSDSFTILVKDPVP